MLVPIALVSAACRGPDSSQPRCREQGRCFREQVTIRLSPPLSAAGGGTIRMQADRAIGKTRAGSCGAAIA
jgi:hypothetical protein